MSFPSFAAGSEVILDESGSIRAAAPRKIVEWLIFKELSPFLFESFMRVYPLYDMSADQLLDLVEQVHAAVPRANREQVISFLVDWINRRYVQDFKGRATLWTQALQLIPSEERAPVINVKEAGDRQYPRVLELKQLASVLDKKRTMAFQRWNSRALCETISLVGHEQFCAMPPHEMCGETDRPFLNKQIALFSRLSNLVVWSIVKAPFPMALLKKFIKMAHTFFKLNNFNALGAVISGLNSGHVQTLKKVWEDLPSASRSLFEKYDALMSPMRNFAEYRAHLANVPRDVPCYPYLAVMTRDLLHINDGNPTFVRDNLINYGKISLLGSFIEEWRVFQTKHYEFTPNLKIVQWLGELTLLPDMSGILLEDEAISPGRTSPGGPSMGVLRKASGRILGKFGGSRSSIASLSPAASPSQSPSTSPQASARRSQSDIRQPRRKSSASEEKDSPTLVVPPSPAVARSQSELSALRRRSSGSAEDLQSASSLVSRFLDERGLRKYEPHFEKHSIRRGHLREINEYDLIAMGITDKEDRHKLVSAIRGEDSGNTTTNDSSTETGNDVENSDGGDVEGEGDIEMPVNVSYNDQVKTIMVNPDACSITQLESIICEAYQVDSASSIVIKLMDFEGDLIRLKKQTDLDYALLHCRGKANVVFHVFPAK